MILENLSKSVLIAVGFMTGTLSLLILSKLEREELSMTNLKLNPESTIIDFRIITLANLLMFSGFIIYIASVLLSNDTLWIISKSIGGIFGILYAGILARWWRRF